jgi:F-type H+-transporting ATPase subunit b
MEALGINIGYFLMQILLFIILYNVLKGYLYNPIINNLEERKTKIAKGLEDARQASIARDNADAEAKKIMDAARSEAVQLRAEAAVQAEETASSIQAQAKKEASDIVAAARGEAEAERNNILAEARSQIAAIAIAAANKIVGESLDESRQRAIIADFFAKVPADATSLSGTSGVVTSAVRLTDAEKAEVKKALGLEEVSFKEDSAILGGLIVRVGDKVVDNSVASRMSAMQDSVK